MRPEVFENIFKGRIDEETATLITKGRQYAKNDDRLWNFKRAAELLDCSPKEACIMFMTKHTIGLYDLCGIGPIPPDKMGQLKEYITDIRNYLVLLEALVIEEREETDATKKS